MNNLEECDRIAQNHEGRCLSREYLGLKAKLTWECKNLHVWDTSLKRVKYNKSWCPFCVYESMKYQFGELTKTADEYGGKCLATEYQDARLKVPWECSYGHRWSASLWEVKQGRWCLECKKNEKIQQLRDEALSLRFEFVDSGEICRSKRLNWKCLDCDQIVRTYFKSLVNEHYCRLI